MKIIFDASLFRRVFYHHATRVSFINLNWKGVLQRDGWWENSKTYVRYSNSNIIKAQTLSIEKWNELRKYQIKLISRYSFIQGVSYRTIIAILFSDVRNLVQKQRPLTSLGIVLDKLARVKKGPTSRKFPTG